MSLLCKKALHRCQLTWVLLAAAAAAVLLVRLIRRRRRRRKTRQGKLRVAFAHPDLGLGGASARRRRGARPAGPGPRRDDLHGAARPAALLRRDPDGTLRVVVAATAARRRRPPGDCRAAGAPRPASSRGGRAAYARLRSPLRPPGWSRSRCAPRATARRRRRGPGRDGVLVCGGGARRSSSTATTGCAALRDRRARHRHRARWMARGDARASRRCITQVSELAVHGGRLPPGVPPARRGARGALPAPSLYRRRGGAAGRGAAPVDQPLRTEEEPGPRRRDARVITEARPPRARGGLRP